MHPGRTLVVAAWLLVSVPFVRAQSTANPSGHWEGSVQVQGTELKIEVDLTKNGKGELAGTIGIPAQNLKALPLLKVVVEGQSVRFHARRDHMFGGALSADGKSMSGDVGMNGYSLPFSLTRTGEPRIEPPARSPAIGKELEGTWNGTLEVSGMPLRLVLTLANHPDGTATGNVVNLDQGGLEIPIATITQKASTVTFEFKVVTSSYSGTLNEGGTEMVGTYTQGALTAPLTFRLAKP